MEAMAVSIPLSVSREPFLFSFVALVERKAEATGALRGFARQTQKGSPHSHEQVVTSPLSLESLMTIQEHPTCPRHDGSTVSQFF